MTADITCTLTMLAVTLLPEPLVKEWMVEESAARWAKVIDPDRVFAKAASSEA